MLEDSFLSLLQKPVRYLGSETNACIKDPSKIDIRIALAFPDIYEIGESNIALKILYSILNNRSNIWAERVYAPWKDAEALLKKNSIPLTSLESGTPICQFDFLGITLSSELCYTNIITILSLSQIPVYAEDRDLRHPLIIGGGPGASNPEPLADFFDLFVLGDGEEVILEIMERWSEVKKDVSNRKELIESFADIKGIYVPHLYRPEYYPEGTIKKIWPRDAASGRVYRRLIDQLDHTLYFTSQVIPFTSSVHDRIAIEIARGCSRGCRFCQAGMIYRPPRERSISRIRELANGLACSTGYEEISLLSLSSGDYKDIGELINLLYHDDPGIGPRVFSLPSLRPDWLPDDVLKLLRRGRKPGFTFAPEAGSERLRNVINKGITDDEILAMAEKIFRAGWDMVKLYFMVGLPSETEEDLLEIPRLVKEMGIIGRRILKKKPRFNLTISPFVPKPHTPFQWVPQEPVESLKQKQELLKRKLSGALVRLKSHTPELSFIEAVLARGDRRVAKVLDRAWKLGARFDQWGEYFNFSLWIDAFDKTNLDPFFYANRQRFLNEIFPWSHLFMGIDEGFLKKEYEKAMAGEQTPDCRLAGCHDCGACKLDLKSGVERIWVDLPEHNESDPKCRAIMETISACKRPDLKIEQTKMRIRFKFAKTDQAIFFSHLDLIRIINLAVRRAKIPVAYSQGFHPSPRISFGPALPVGIEGLSEYIDMDLTQELYPQKILERLNFQLPKGIHLLEGTDIPIKVRSLVNIINEAQYRVLFPKQITEKFGPFSYHMKALQNMMGKDSIHCLREAKKGDKVIDVRSFIKDIQLIKNENGMEIFLKLKMSPDQNVRLCEVLEAIYGPVVKDWSGQLKISRLGLFASFESECESEENKENTPQLRRDPICIV